MPTAALTAPTIETRRTDWLTIDGLAPYRIWTQFDGLRFFQRHEWRNADGSTEIEGWIPGGTCHVAGGKSAEAAR